MTDSIEMRSWIEQELIFDEVLANDLDSSWETHSLSSSQVAPTSLGDRFADAPCVSAFPPDRTR